MGRHLHSYYKDKCLKSLVNRTFKMFILLFSSAFNIYYVMIHIEVIFFSSSHD